MGARPLSKTQANALLAAVQHEVPLVERPFLQIAGALSIDEEDALAQLGEWAQDGTLREISGVLEGSLLGWSSALCTGSVPEAGLERAVAVLDAHPTVTHNYLREHACNLWFTIAVPPGMGLEETLSVLARRARVDVFHALERTATYKIGVSFDPETLTNRTVVTARREATAFRPDAREQRLFRALQTPLAIESRPFDALAAQAGVPVQELLDFAGRHLGAALRRYVGTLRHRKLGVHANGMSVWDVRDDERDAIGRAMAEVPEVSHCYARNAIPGFPYTLYAMLHAATRERCLGIAEELSRRIGERAHLVLFSTREFKKVRLRYFLPELDTWWAARNEDETR